MHPMEHALSGPAMTTTNGSPSATTAPASGSDTGDAERVNKIRELLFGEQMSAYDQRFTVLEQRLADRIAHLEELLRKLDAAAVKRLDLADQFEALARLLRQRDDGTPAT